MYAGDWPRRADRPLNTDYHPRLEFQSLVTAWTPGSRLRYERLRSFQTELLMDLPDVGVRLIPLHGQVAMSRQAARKFQRDELAD